MDTNWPKQSESSKISVQEIEVMMRSYGVEKCTTVRVARAYLRQVGNLHIDTKSGLIKKK